MPFSKDPATIGTKLGPKLVHLISQTIITTKRGLLHTEHRARVGSMQEIIDRAGHEIADLYRPVMADAVESSNMPDEHKEFMRKALSGRHQWQAIAGFALGASGAPSAINQIMSNYLADNVRSVISKDPLLVPSNETWAQLTARGIVDPATAKAFVRGGGYDDYVFSVETEGYASYPPVADALQLLRRNLIAPQDFLFYCNRNGIPEPIQGLYMKLAEIPLSPSDLADMTIRGIISEAEAAKIAAESGVPAEDFHRLVLDTGEPPGLMQMLEGYRRGFIGRAELEHGIRQSRYRDEWIPLIEKLRYSPMSVADAVNAVVQNHLTATQGAAVADQNGLEPGAFDTLAATAGEPLSRTEMEELYNRGIASEGQVKQALRESRVKDKYVDLAFDLHRKLVPPRTLHQFVTSGVMTHEQALKEALWFGYSPSDAAAFVGAGSVTKMATHTASVVSAITALYEDNAITEAKATDLISRLKFDKIEAGFILQAAELRRQARAVNSAVTAIRAKYLARHITAIEASAKLDSIGIPSERRDYLLGLWAIEQSAAVRTLTPAQVHKAFKNGLIEEADALSRLIADGYNDVDAKLILEGA